MTRTVITAVILFTSAGAYAADLNLNSNPFSDIGAAGIENLKTELPVPAAALKPEAKCGHVEGEITKLHLLAMTAKSMLYTHADNEALFNEFTAMWTPILVKFSFKPGAAEYAKDLGTLKYDSADGRVIRDFMADQLNYNALDPAEMRKLQHELLEPLEKAGMTPIASFNIKNDILRPTFNIYYLTTPNENPEHEIRLRQLKIGDDLDFDILANAGLQFVKKDTAFSVAYIGKALGFKSFISSSEEALQTKLENYKKFLKERNKEFIAARIIKIDPYPVGNITYNYSVNIYFYQ